RSCTSERLQTEARLTGARRQVRWGPGRAYQGFPAMLLRRSAWLVSWSMPELAYEPLLGERHRHRGIEHAHPHDGPHVHIQVHGHGGHGHSHGLVDASIKRSRDGLRAVLLSL